MKALVYDQGGSNRATARTLGVSPERSLSLIMRRSFIFDSPSPVQMYQEQSKEA